MAKGSGTTYTVGGNVTGLTNAESVKLTNNGSDTLTVTGTKAFTFSRPMSAESIYNIQVSQQTSSKTCTVAAGTSLELIADVTNVEVTCSATTFTIEGSISGLTKAGLVLSNDGVDDQTIAVSASIHQFTTGVASGGAIMSKLSNSLQA